MTRIHNLVLFDMDGTLSDPLAGIGHSINDTLSRFGYAPVALDGVAPHVGMPLERTFQSLTGVASPECLNAFVAAFREHYARVGCSENAMYPGMTEALDGLDDAGIPLAVCTSKRTCLAERILDRLGIRSRFRFVSGGDAGAPKWRRLERMLSEGRIGRSSIMVGDRGADLAAAHRNHLCAAGVLWGYGSRRELEREQPRYLLDSPSAISLLEETLRPVVPFHAGSTPIFAGFGLRLRRAGNE